MTSPADLIDRAGARLEKQAMADVADSCSLDENPMSEEGSNLTDKIRFTWRKEDEVTLERIKYYSQHEFEETFGRALGIIDRLYECLRIPEQNEYGVVRVDAHGRPVWKRDPQTGNILESWDQLTGDVIEKTLLDLRLVKFAVSPRVNELLLLAIYARDVATDVRDDAWKKIIDGTVGDKTSKANREARSDKYHAFFRFYLYSSAKTFLDEIDKFVDTLERIRYWQVQSTKG